MGARVVALVDDRAERPGLETEHGLSLYVEADGEAVLLDAGEYEAMQERIELLQDVHASIGQIEDGKGIEHDDAMAAVLKRIKR